jgi:hypothetical protein
MGLIKVHEEDLWAVESGLRNIIALADVLSSQSIIVRIEAIQNTVYAMLNKQLRD